MYRISKKFTFSASHKLNGLPDDHPCSRDHGHNYTVTVFFGSTQLDENGMIRDYRELDKIKEWIDIRLDHRCLNDMMIGNPTAENIAGWLYTVFSRNYPDLYRIEVSETDKTSASFEPSYDPS